MKDSILKVALNEEMEVSYEAGANVLNQHSVARQYLEVSLKNTSLAGDEELYVGFSYGSKDRPAEKPYETAYIYLPCVDGVYRTEMPYDVTSRRGLWTGTFAVKSDFVTETDGDGTELRSARRVRTSKPFEFAEYSALEDGGGKVPTITDIKNYYDSANNALASTTEAAEEANRAAEEAAAAVTNVTNIINTAKVGFSYDSAKEELTLTVFTDTGA